MMSMEGCLTHLLNWLSNCRWENHVWFGLYCLMWRPYCRLFYCSCFHPSMECKPNMAFNNILSTQWLTLKYVLSNIIRLYSIWRILQKFIKQSASQICHESGRILSWAPWLVCSTMKWHEKFLKCFTPWTMR